MPRLQPGDDAPSFTLLDQSASPLSLSDFMGRKVLVYFYPQQRLSHQSWLSVSRRPELAECSASSTGKQL
jgi:hypothetical protein